MNDDDVVASGIILVAVVVIIWACTGCSVPGKVDGDQRPPEQTGSITPVNRATLTAATPIMPSQPVRPPVLDPAPHRAEMADIQTAAQPTETPQATFHGEFETVNLRAVAPSTATNITKRVRWIRGTQESVEAFEQRKRAAGYQ